MTSSDDSTTWVLQDSSSATENGMIVAGRAAGEARQSHLDRTKAGGRGAILDQVPIDNHVARQVNQTVGLGDADRVGFSACRQRQQQCRQQWKADVASDRYGRFPALRRTGGRP
jgi:hypothetical protein